jgi:hypothetical protein
MEDAMRWIGKDANGISRVFGEHDNPDVAETMCREEAISYVRRRPDTGPLDRWTIRVDGDDAAS